MNATQPRTRLRAALALAGALIIAPQVVIWRPASAPPLENPQMMLESARIFRNITRSQGTFSTTVVKYPGNSQLIHVQMRDNATDGVVTLAWKWQGAAHELREATCTLQKRPEELPALSKAEAARATLRWIKALGLGAEAAQWRLAADPERWHGIYIARWIAPDREAVVTVQDHTGALTTARIRPQPTH